MKITSTTLVLLAAVSGVMADNCKTGLNYCGYGLLKKGNYQGQIDQALLCSGQNSNNFRDALFHCVGGPSGLVTFIKKCNSCEDGGSGRNDFC